MMNQTKKHTTGKKLLALLLALIMTVSLLPMSVFAAETDAGFTLNANTRFYVVSETDPTGTEVGDFVQLIDSEFAAKKLPSSDVLPIMYGAENGVQDGDIVVKVDSSLGEQSYQIVITAAQITVTGGDAAGVFYGLTELLQMFEKNTTLAAQKVENSPLVAERSVYIDCGRVYYSPDLLKALIKTMAWNKMNTLYLDFSNNNATRFFLDNMEVTVGDTSTAAQAEPVDDAPVADTAPVVTDAAPEAALDEAAPVMDGAPAAEEASVSAEPEQEEPQQDETVQDVPAVQSQDVATMASTSTTYDIRKAIPSDGEYLTQDDMDGIIEVANQYGVQIIPTFNSPGHIGGLYSLNSDYFDRVIPDDYDSKCGKVTLLIENADAYEFGIKVNELYIDYFASRGCKSFNIAADEATLGTVKYNSDNEYFVKYVKELNTYIKSKGMTTRMFNDGIESESSSDIDKDITVLYWAPEGTAESFVNEGRSVVNFSYGAGLYFAYGASWWVWNQPVKTIYDGWYPGALCRNTGDSYQNNYVVTEKIDSSKLLGASFAVWADYAIQSNNVNGTTFFTNNTNNVMEKIQVVGERCWTNSSTDSYSTWKNSLTTAPGGIDVSSYKIDGTTLPTASAFAKVSTEPELVVDDTTGAVKPVKQENGNYAVTVKEKDTLQLKVTNYNAGLKWKSSDDTIATVENGLVTFTGKAGTVTITAEPAVATRVDNTVFTATFDVAAYVAGNLENIPAYAEGKVTGDNSVKYVLDTDDYDSGSTYLIVAKDQAQALLYKNGSISKTAVTIKSDNTATVNSSSDENNALWTITDGVITNTNNSSYGLYIYQSGLYVSNYYSYYNNYTWTIGDANATDGTRTISQSIRSSYGNTRTLYLSYSSSSFGLSGYSNTVRLYKQVKGGYTVDTDSLVALINYAEGLSANDFSNWDVSGVEGALTAAKTALAAVKDSYTVESAAITEQTNVNTAAKALYDALEKLVQKAGVDITVICVDENGDRLFETTIKAYETDDGKYEYNTTPPSISGYSCVRGNVIKGTLNSADETLTLVYRTSSFKPPVDCVEIPITIVDYRADGLLFDFSISGTSIAYQLVHISTTDFEDTAQAAISGTTMEGLTPKDNALGRASTWYYGGSGAFVRKGMVETQLGANGMPVYTKATVEYVADKLSKGYCNNGAATNWNNILYDTFISASATRSVRNTSTDSFSAAFENTKSYENISNAYDLAWYLLNTLYIGDTNMAEVTDKRDGKGETYTLPIYGMADNTYNKLFLVQDTDGTYYMKAYVNPDKDESYRGKPYIKYDEANGAIYNSADNNDNTSYFFYPLCNKGYDAYLGDSTDGFSKEEADADYPVNPNGNYTLRGESQFVYHEGKNQYFEFTGDDDVYLFINGKLALDLGGAHWSLMKRVNMDDIAEACDLEDGKVATFTFFYMERYSDCSNFGIRTNLELVQRGIEVEKKGYDADNNEVSSGSVIENKATVAYDLTVTNQGGVAMEQIKFEDTDVYGATVSFGYGVEESKFVATADSSAMFMLADSGEYELYITNAAGTVVTDSRKTPATLEALSKAVAEIKLDPGQTLHVRFLQVTANVAASKMAEYTNTVTVTAVSGTELSDDAIHVLYSYNTDDTIKDYVVDFGLPLKITGIFDQSAKDYIVDEAVKQSSDCVLKYGMLAISGTGFGTELTYTLNERTSIDAVETIKLDVKYKFDVATPILQKTIRIIPATTVYYEDDFMSFTNMDGTVNDIAAANETDVANGKWQRVGTQVEANQALDQVGVATANNYGYDPAYTSSKTFSLGSAVKVTVDKDSKGIAGWPYATFTFMGTGFDIISLTDNTSGAIYVDIYKGAEVNENNRVTGYVVNNYYGYTYDKDTDTWTSSKDADGNNAIYQVPVIKASGLDYDKYTVKIMVGFSKYQNVTGTEQYSFWMDAIRVYDPANALDDYAKDGEQNPDFVELRKVLLDAESFNGNNTIANGAVFIDGKGTDCTIDDYKNYGPNHEVYLAAGQAIAFQLVANAKPAGLQLGAKLANSDSAELTVKGATIKAEKKDQNGADTLTLTTATDMFYTLDVGEGTEENGLWKSPVITLTNSGIDGMISLTNLKLINAEYVETKDKVANAAEGQVLVTMMMDADAAQEAIAAVDSVLHPQEVKTFEPERFEVSWNRSTVKVGQKATLTVKTSTDVDAITVDGVTVTNYRTRTQRTGWGWNATKVTYREFTYTITAAEAGTLNVSVAAINAEGTVSEPITAALTVQAAAQRPGIGGWLNNIFGRWF